MASGSDIVALARSKAGQWRYSNDTWERMNPEQSGATDCSGFARWLYLTGAGIDIGTWTGDESKAGREIARGQYPSQIPWDSIQPGDLILMTAKYPGNYDFNAYLCHIEIYCGGGTMIGHPGGYGPQEKRAQAWMEAYGCTTWMVRRVLDGDNGHVPTPAPSSGIPDLRYRVCPVGGSWLPEMVNHYDPSGSGDDYAGNGNPIGYLALQMSGWYQVCSENSGWLPPVRGYDINDIDNGCAGDGSPIKMVRAYNETQDPNTTGWLAIEYAVANVGGPFFANMVDLRDTSGSGDDFAGNGGNVSAFRARLIRV